MGRIGKSLVIGFGWVMLGLPARSLRAALALSQPNAAVLCPGENEGLNSIRQGDAIALGRIRSYHYVVVVPVVSRTTLRQVRQCVSDAFVTDSRLGAYVQAGIFKDRKRAEALSAVLRSLKLDARVVYFP